MSAKTKIPQGMVDACGAAWSMHRMTIEKRIMEILSAAGVAEMHAALMDVQWSNGGFCPQCAQGPVKGHQPKCLIGVALKKAVQA
jgi:hypothetical protein